jgi:hypothetical protein
VPRAYLASQYCNLHCNIATFLATSLQAIVAVEPCNARSPSGVARNADEIERAVTALADSANGGRIVTSSVHHDLIIGLATGAAWPSMDRIASTSFGAGRLRRSHFQGRETDRSPCAGADQVRVSDQPKTARALGLALPTR